MSSLSSLSAPVTSTSSFLVCEPTTAVTTVTDIFTTTYCVTLPAACETSAWLATYTIEEECTGNPDDWVTPACPSNFVVTTVHCDLCDEPDQVVTCPNALATETGIHVLENNGITATVNPAWAVYPTPAPAWGPGCPGGPNCPPAPTGVPPPPPCSGPDCPPPPPPCMGPNCPPPPPPCNGPNCPPPPPPCMGPNCPPPPPPCNGPNCPPPPPPCMGPNCPPPPPPPCTGAWCPPPVNGSGCPGGPNCPKPPYVTAGGVSIKASLALVGALALAAGQFLLV